MFIRVYCQYNDSVEVVVRVVKVFEIIEHSYDLVLFSHFKVIPKTTWSDNQSALIDLGEHQTLFNKFTQVAMHMYSYVHTNFSTKSYLMLFSHNKHYFYIYLYISYEWLPIISYTDTDIHLFRIALCNKSSNTYTCL